MLAALLLVACDPCADLACEPGTCPALAEAAGPEGLLTVQLASVRRLADAHHMDTATGTRRIRVADGRTVGVVSVPAPLGMHPVEGQPQRIRITSTTPMRVFEAPERPRPDQMKDVGSLVVVWRIEAGIEVGRSAGSFVVKTALLGDAKPDVRLTDGQRELAGSLSPAQIEAALDMARGLAERQALTAAAEGQLLQLRPWAGVAGAEQLAHVEPHLEGGMLQLRLRPGSPTGTPLDPSPRQLQPGLEQAATLALSPSWVAALASVDETASRRVVLADGVPYRVSARSEGLDMRQWSLVAHGRAADTCGWVDLSLPSTVGRTPAGWGLAAQAAPIRVASGGAAPEALDRLVGERVHERVSAVLAHPLLRGPLQERFQTVIGRTDAGALLQDLTVIPGSSVPARAPRVPAAPPAD